MDKEIAHHLEQMRRAVRHAEDVAPYNEKGADVFLARAAHQAAIATALMLASRPSE